MAKNELTSTQKKKLGGFLVYIYPLTNPKVLEDFLRSSRHNSLLQAPQILKHEQTAKYLKKKHKDKLIWFKVSESIIRESICLP